MWLSPRRGNGWRLAKVKARSMIWRKALVPPSLQGCERRIGWVLLGFLAIAAFFLWEEHKAHLLGILPYGLLLLSPLMHLFHGGHGGGNDGHNHAAKGDQR